MDQQMNKYLEPWAKEFLRNIEYLSDQRTWLLFRNKFITPLEGALSEKRGSFYNDKNEKAEIFKQAIVETSGKVKGNRLKDIFKMYTESPFGLFEPIFSVNASDVFILHEKISFTVGNREAAVELTIPNNLMPTYHELVEIFVNLTLYASSRESTKFDRANAVLDFAVGTLRFNIVDDSLNAANNSPIIAIRKQLIKSTATISNTYLNSLGITQNQYNFIQKIGRDGSFIIFGETGSGKTTLMKYMGMQGIEKKRNLITIEDTPELFLPVNIAYLTNDKYGISDLFKMALRENPSHMIIGETRDATLKDILDSGLVFRVGTTLHADSFEKVIMRMIFMCKSASTNYTSEDICNLITAVCDGFIHMKDRKVVGMWRKKSQTSSLDGNIINDYEEVR